MFAIWLVCVFSIVISTMFFSTSFDLPALRADPGGPAIVPQILSLITAASSLAYLSLVIKKQNGIYELKQSITLFFIHVKAGLRAEESEGVRVFSVMLASMAYLWILQEFGFIVSTVILFGFLCWLCRLPAKKALPMMAGIPLLIFWLFNDILSALVPRGNTFDILTLF